jgi:hypothetical protein
MRAPAGGVADVVYVLCLMQAAFLLLAAVGETLLMGFNPAYLVIPVAKVVLLLVFATKAVSGRRWALIGLIVLHAVTLLGYAIQFWAGFLPWVDHTVNLVGLLTNLALPAAVLVMCAGRLGGGRRGRRSRPVAVEAHYLAAAHDPYAPAPLVTSATAVDVAR